MWGKKKMSFERFLNCLDRDQIYITERCNEGERDGEPVIYWYGNERGATILHEIDIDYLYEQIKIGG